LEIPVAEETSKAVGTATFADSRDVHISKNNSSSRDASNSREDDKSWDPMNAYGSNNMATTDSTATV
jgi:hypothetical protein